MDGERIVIGGRTWVKQVTEHWLPGTHEDGPSDYSVTFYDPDDRNQWVCHCRVPAGEAELGPDGLRGIFRRAGLRSWRDPSGTYWRICTCPARSSFGSDGDAGGTDGAISFRRRDHRGADVITRDVRARRPLGQLTDEELREIMAPAT